MVNIKSMTISKKKNKVATKNPETGILIEIKPAGSLVKIDFEELWRFRELLYILVWRNVKVRYKQTIVGVAWAIFQPLLTMIIFTIFFGRLAQMPSDNIPYPVFVFAGLVYWNYFSTALGAASGAMVENEGIIKKIYFPRLLIPFSATVTPAIDFGIALIVLVVLMIYYHLFPTFIGVLITPVLILISLMAVTGLGLVFASANVKYRDVRYILPFFIQILMFLTPVIYPVSIIPAKFQWLIYANPMAGVITVARTSFLGSGSTNWQILGISAGLSLVWLIFGLYYFRRTEKFFADII